MTKKLDRRTAYTRMVIKESLYKLLEKKHLSEITVKELCAQADINRTTFYRNYMDIYDLYEQLEEELIEQVPERDILRAILAQYWFQDACQGGLVLSKITNNTSSTLKGRWRNRKVVLVEKTAEIRKERGDRLLLRNHANHP